MYIIPTKFTAIDMLTPPVLRMQKAMMGLTTIAGTNGQILQKSLQATNMAAMQVATSAGMMGAAILLPMGLATKAAIDFEKQMGNVATLVDTTKENMTLMGDQVLQIASRVPVAISDLTESLYQIRSAGVGAADAMHVLEVSAKLSVAGLSTATDATKAVTSAMVAFKQQGLTADQIANSFFLTVQEGKTKMADINMAFGSNALLVANAGVTLQEFNAATAAMTNAGFNAAEAQTAFRMATTALIKPTGEMTKILHTMGFTGINAGTDLIKKMGGVTNAMVAIDKAGRSAGDNVYKAFGRIAGVNALIALTGNQNAQFQANFKAQMEGADAMTSAYAKQLGTTASQVQLAKNNIQILAITLGAALLPSLTSVLKEVIVVTRHLNEWAHNHKTLAGLIVKGITYFGLFAVTIGAVSFAIGTITKATWLWNAAIVSFNFVQGIALGLMGRMAPVLLTSNAAYAGYVASTYAAAGATRIFNLSAMGLMATLTRVAALTGIIYGVMKLFNRRDEAKDKMNAILPHLPKGIDPQKFQDQFQDALHPGFIPLAKRLQGVRAYYPQATYDTLVEKYYTQPMKEQDSLVESAKHFSPNVPKQDTSVNLYLNIDKSGNATVSTKGGNGAVPINVTDTSSFR